MFDDFTAAMAAATQGHDACLKALIQARADVNAHGFSFSG
jgi:hypothetical protein